MSNERIYDVQGIGMWKMENLWKRKKKKKIIIKM